MSKFMQSPVFPHIETDVNLEDESLQNPCMNADIAQEIVVVDLIRGRRGSINNSAPSTKYWQHCRSI